MFGLKFILSMKVSFDKNITGSKFSLVNLHQEYMDLSMTLSMMWVDDRLQWNETEFSGVDYIQEPADSIWYPDLEVQNRLLDYPPGDEKLNRAWINSDGQVWLTRFFRLRASFDPAVADFWYDSQTPKIIIQSADRNQDYVITTKDWDLANGKKEGEAATARVSAFARLVSWGKS